MSDIESFFKCDLCKHSVLFVHMKTKKIICDDCHPDRGAFEMTNSEEWAEVAEKEWSKSWFDNKKIAEIFRRAQEQATTIENTRCAEFYERKIKAMVEHARREAIEECLDQMDCRGDEDCDHCNIRALLEDKK